MTGERACFRGNALLHAAVACETNHMLIENSVLASVESRRGHFHRNCDSGGVANALPKRASRAFHTRCLAKFWMSRRFTVQLPKPFDFRHWQIVSAQVQPGVEKHTAVSGGEDKIVPADPARLLRIMFEIAPVKHRAHFGTAKRQSQMSRFRRLHCLHAPTARLICRPTKPFGISAP